MATTIAKPLGTANGSGNGGLPRGGGGNGSSFRHWGVFDTASLGMVMGLAGISMLFIALTSSYIVREGFDPGWQAIRMPTLLPLNTVILLISSITMEKARCTAKAGVTSRWLTATLLLGVAFLGGQVMAWRQLSASGIYMSTNPHSSFFYLLTALHGLHILGGIVAVSWTVLHRPGGMARLAQVIAMYWHFMGGLWVYLLVLLFAWR